MHVGGEPALVAVDSIVDVKASFEMLRREDTKEGMLKDMPGKMSKRPSVEAFL